MPRRTPGLFPVLVVLLHTLGWVGAQTRGETQVVVNLGPYASIEEAAHGEGEVDWLDADTADDTIATECFAALELRRVMRKMTGRADDFVVVDDDKPCEGDLILVGSPASNAESRRLSASLGVSTDDVAALPPEGYRMRSAVVDGRRVTLIAGGGRVGTLYAAYDLLYRLGCRWFAPGEASEQAPQVDRVPDLDVTQRPSFLTRGFHAWEDRADDDFLIWMARNRLNYWCVQQSNHPLMRKLGIQMSCGGHDLEWRFLNPHEPYPYNHPKFQGDEQMPADPYPAGDESPNDADADGRLSYFEAHPEWYPLQGGRRVPGIRNDNPGFGTNYCTSNEHATTEFMKNFAQALVDGPYQNADVVRFWTLDVGKWCDCTDCKALGTRTDRNLLLVDRANRAIRKARNEGKINRRVIIRFLAYADVLEPPSRPLAADFDYRTASATFFPIVRCYVHNFDDPSCPRNAHYLRQLDGWAIQPDRHYQGELCIGEYYNVSGYRCLPICFMHTMANDIPYYHKIGARHFHYMHVTTGNWGNKTLTNFQMARQIWDVETDCSLLWDDYFSRRYGPAAGTMREFYETLEKMLSNVSELKYGLARRLNRGAKDLFTTSELRYDRTEGVECIGPTLLEIVDHAGSCRALLDLAADLPDEIKARIGGDERMFTYGERTVGYYLECV
ncbi:MAG: DUF4838 domain-containing protein, partial [Planctomycetes bacterium]|nr:DUF4838 domain-containing protein [Planctomycetota bacterium]